MWWRGHGGRRWLRCRRRLLLRLSCLVMAARSHFSNLDLPLGPCDSATQHLLPEPFDFGRTIQITLAWENLEFNVPRWTVPHRAFHYSIASTSPNPERKWRAAQRGRGRGRRRIRRGRRIPWHCGSRRRHLRPRHRSRAPQVRFSLLLLGKLDLPLQWPLLFKNCCTCVCVHI